MPINVKITDLPVPAVNKGLLNDLFEIARAGGSYRLPIQLLQDAFIVSTTYATLKASLTANTCIKGLWKFTSPYSGDEIVVETTNTNTVKELAYATISTGGSIDYSAPIGYDLINDIILWKYDVITNNYYNLGGGLLTQDPSNIQINLHVTLQQSNYRKDFDIDGSNTIDASVDAEHNWAGVLNISTAGQLDTIAGLSLLPNKIRVQPSRAYADISNESNPFTVGDAITGTDTLATGIITKRIGVRIYIKVLTGDFSGESELTNQNLDTANVDSYVLPQTVTFDPTLNLGIVFTANTVAGGNFTLDGNNGDFIDLENDLSGDVFEYLICKY